MVQKSLDGAEVHGFVVHDNLREMLLCEDSANHHLMSEMEQQEFLWKLFRHLVFGGQLNQYEDDADQYRQAAKSLYRTLIRCEHGSLWPITIPDRADFEQAVSSNLSAAG